MALDVEQVRHLLWQEANSPGASVADIARRVGVPAHTLRRFISREIDTPRPQQWRAFLAYVTPPDLDGDAWERGVLEAVGVMQRAAADLLRQRGVEPPPSLIAAVGKPR